MRDARRARQQIAMNSAFIGSVLRYQPLMTDLGLHARSSFAALVLLENTKTDLTRWSVGCTTRSAPP